MTIIICGSDMKLIDNFVNMVNINYFISPDTTEFPII